VCAAGSWLAGKTRDKVCIWLFYRDSGIASCGKKLDFLAFSVVQPFSRGLQTGVKSCPLFSG